MFEMLGPLISAGAKIFGGIMGDSATAERQQAQIAAQQDLAHHGITYRAADARDAEKTYGINALAALGVPTGQFNFTAGDDKLGASIGEAGGDVGRAVAAMSPNVKRQQELEQKLLEAKIANVNSDTVRNQAIASEMVTKLGQPGTAPGIPFPRPDPRGPVIPLVQRAWDARTNEYVWIPSKEAASPLQTLAATPTNAALAGRSLSEGLMGFPGNQDHWNFVRPDIYRGVDNSQYVPF